MKIIFGAALTCGMIAIPGYIVWRIVVDVESWFATSGAGDCIMWSFVIALMLTAYAIPVGVWGLAARMWVVKLDRGEYLVSTAYTLAPPHVVVAQLGTTAPSADPRRPGGGNRPTPTLTCPRRETPCTPSGSNRRAFVLPATRPPAAPTANTHANIVG